MRVPQRKVRFLQTFHNTTTHYNWYFNGEETLKKSIKKLEENHQEDFNQLLPIFLLERKDTEYHPHWTKL